MKDNSGDQADAEYNAVADIDDNDSKKDRGDEDQVENSTLEEINNVAAEEQVEEGMIVDTTNWFDDGLKRDGFITTDSISNEGGQDKAEKVDSKQEIGEELVENRANSNEEDKGKKQDPEEEREENLEDDDIDDNSDADPDYIQEKLFQSICT